MRVTLRAILGICLVLSISSTVAWSQSTTATVQGTVMDSTGAVVPNADVKVTNTATGLTRTTKTVSAGSYLISALPIGSYNIEVQSSGM